MINQGKGNTVIEINGNEIVFTDFNRNQEDAYFSMVNGLNIRHLLTIEEYEIRIDSVVKNDSDESIAPNNLELFGNITITSGADYETAYTACRDMLGFCGPQRFSQEWTSYGICGITDNVGENAVLMGYEDMSSYFFQFSIKKEDNTIIIKPSVPFEFSVIAPGESVTLPTLTIKTGESLTGLLKTFAGSLAKNMRDTNYEFGKPASGFCSWYTHYGTETQDDIKEMIISYEKSQIKERLDYFLIDGGWNEDSGDPDYNWGDWEAKNKFQQGMKYISDYIHEHGFKSGLWIAPFAITRNSSIFKDHPDWIVGQGKDLLNNGGSTYGLDLTHPEVQIFVRDNITKIVDKWGFDYIKIDFLLYGALVGERYDNSKTSAMAFREGMKIIREAAKGRLILNCGSPLFQSTGLCDAMRIGPDVGSRWFFPLNESIWQYGNCCVKAGMRYIIYTQWMNRILWYNDPDCLVARGQSNKIEYHQFMKFFPGMQIDEDKFGLKYNEFSAFGKLIWFTQGLFFLSDLWDKLDEDRKELLVRLSVPNTQETQLVDFYERYDVAIFKTVSGALKLGIFNIGDEEEKISIPSRKLGIDSWTFREMTEDINFEGSGDTVVFPAIPPHSGYIFEKQ